MTPPRTVSQQLKSSKQIYYIAQKWQTINNGIESYKPGSVFMGATFGDHSELRGHPPADEAFFVYGTVFQLRRCAAATCSQPFARGESSLMDVTYSGVLDVPSDGLVVRSKAFLGTGENLWPSVFRTITKANSV